MGCSWASCQSGRAVRYLLDTNICIHAMGRQPAHLLQRLDQVARGEAVISIITYAELRAGIEKLADTRARNERALRLFVQHLPVLAFDEAAARSYGVLRAAVPDRCRNALDRLIAAHALSRGLTLVTSNEADFRDYPGLEIENWSLAARPG